MTVPIGMLDRSTIHGPYRQRHLWFGPADRPLSGWLATPPTGRARGGVVVVPPLGAEVFHTYRTLRRLTDDLAEAGLLALRFDFDGTGDSAGSVEDPRRVELWLASVREARRQLVALGAPSVSVVALRSGVLPAAYDALAEPGLDGLVLWDPVASGRAFVREGEALFGMGVQPRTELDPELRHTPGFQFDGPTARDLRALDLTRLPEGRLAERVLLLERPDRPGTEVLREALVRQTSGELQVLAATEQAALLDGHAGEAMVPEKTLAAITDWLLSAPREAVEVRRAVHPLAAEVAPGVLERTVSLGEVGLFGMVTEPVKGGTDSPWIVFVNTAGEHHIGPGRQWVEWARSWAAAGYRSVRLDQSGIGDSPTRPTQPEDVVFAPEWIDDMPDAVRTLRADGSRVVMLGLCAGAYSSMEAALWTDVDAIVAINPRLTLFPAARGTHAFTGIRRAAIVPALPITWVPPKRRLALAPLWRAYRQVAVWNSPARVLRRVVGSGTRLYVLACSDDVRDLTEVVAWRPVLGLLRRTGRYLLRERPEFDHDLLTRGAQQVARSEARAIVDELRRSLA